MRLNGDMSFQGSLATSIVDTDSGELRAAAFGALDFTSGLATLIASLLAGALWNRYGTARDFRRPMTKRCDNKAALQLRGGPPLVRTIRLQAITRKNALFAADRLQRRLGPDIRRLSLSRLGIGLVLSAGRTKPGAPSGFPGPPHDLGCLVFAGG
jgi:hypothetical protein